MFISAEKKPFSFKGFTLIYVSTINGNFLIFECCYTFVTVHLCNIISRCKQTEQFGNGQGFHVKELIILFIYLKYDVECVSRTYLSIKLSPKQTQPVYSNFSHSDFVFIRTRLQLGIYYIYIKHTFKVDKTSFSLISTNLKKDKQILRFNKEINDTCACKFLMFMVLTSNIL